jgi:hypothetical protein
VVDTLATPADRRAAIAASAKPDMAVLDFVGNAGRHKIVTAGDVLGGAYGTPVREYARETIAQEERPVPVAEALERAEAELDLLEEERQRRRRITAQAAYQLRQVSPFDRRQSAPPSGGAGALRRGKAPSEKQVNYLVHLGVSRATALGYTRRQASAVIDKLLAQRGGRS